jgi:hypothetical protein
MGQAGNWRAVIQQQQPAFPSDLVPSGKDAQLAEITRRSTGQVWLPVVDNLRTLFVDPPAEMRLLFGRLQELGTVV